MIEEPKHAHPEGMVEVKNGDYRKMVFFVHLPSSLSNHQECTHCVFSSYRSSNDFPRECVETDCNGGAFLRDEDEALRFKLLGKDALR